MMRLETKDADARNKEEKKRNMEKK